MRLGAGVSHTESLAESQRSKGYCKEWIPNGTSANGVSVLACSVKVNAFGKAKAQGLESSLVFSNCYWLGGEVWRVQ